MQLEKFRSNVYPELTKESFTGVPAPQVEFRVQTLNLHNGNVVNNNYVVMEERKIQEADIFRDNRFEWLPIVVLVCGILVFFAVFEMFALSRELNACRYERKMK
jgi:hypothetical protein